MKNFIYVILGMLGIGSLILIVWAVIAYFLFSIALK